MVPERRRSLKHSIEPNWSDMKGHYNALLPIVKKAKRVREQNPTENWPAMIKAAFPQLDADLIMLLSNDPEDLEALPEAVRKATEKGEDYSLPANFALEQSARNCGMKDFDLGPRRIRELMDKSGK